jgi:dolichol-phosphate mannosyltransferase
VTGPQPPAGGLRAAVILPMFNEADNVAPLLARLATVRERSGLDLRAIAVDDGSRDLTWERLGQARQGYGFLLAVQHPANRGLAGAIRTGIATALAEREPPIDAVACMDSDLTHDPEDLPRLLDPIARDQADFVLGSRYVVGGGMRDVSWERRAISVLGNGVGRGLLGVPAADLTSGYRAARSEVYRAITLEEPGFGIQLEGTVKAYRAGFRIAEVPITLGVRQHGYSKMVYTRAFWFGYMRLFVALMLHRERSTSALGRPVL